jgi:hypothetical protein
MKSNIGNMDCINACGNYCNLQLVQLSKRIYLCKECAFHEERCINTSRGAPKIDMAEDAGSQDREAHIKSQISAALDELKTYFEGAANA